MEIICNQNELNNAIQLVSKAVASRPTHPILANILLTADQGTHKISLTGFDLNLGIQTSFDGTVKNSGAITIPSKLLSEIVNKLPNETPVSLKVDENSDSILCRIPFSSCCVRLALVCPTFCRVFIIYAVHFISFWTIRY